MPEVECGANHAWRNPCKGQRGQATVEYMLAVLALTLAFAGAYGVIGGGIKGAFGSVVKLITG